MKNITLILIAMSFWGISGIFAKLGVSALGPITSIFLRTIFFFSVVVAYFAIKEEMEISITKETLYPIAAGISIGTAVLFFYNALNFYDISLVRPFVSLNIIVTLAFSVIFLDEEISLTKLTGIGVALIALVILSM